MSNQIKIKSSSPTVLFILERVLWSGKPLLQSWTSQFQDPHQQHSGTGCVHHVCRCIAAKSFSSYQTDTKWGWQCMRKQWFTVCITACYSDTLSRYRVVYSVSCYSKALKVSNQHSTCLCPYVQSAARVYGALGWNSWAKMLYDDTAPQLSWAVKSPVWMTVWTIEMAHVIFKNVFYTN